MTIQIVTDSTCDLPEAMIAEYGITVVPLYINFGDQSYLDGVELSRQEFYERLPECEPPPTTAAPGPEVYRQAYERLAGEGATEVLSIHISISLSAVVDVARLGAKETEAVPVTVFDSRQLSVGTGFLVLTAAKAVAEGRSMDEIMPRLEEQVSRTHVFAGVADQAAAEDVRRRPNGRKGAHPPARHPTADHLAERARPAGAGGLGAYPRPR
jgi:DegV family protein with EDD domain